MKEELQKTSRLKSLLGTAIVAATIGQAPLVNAEVILHAFNWSYDEVAAKANEIADLGYKKVLVAPPLKSAPFNCQWWARYQPQDYRVIDHCLGNKEDFEGMVAALAGRQVEVYADIVLNHMANERNGATDFPGTAALNNYSANSAYWQEQRLFGNLNDGLFSWGDFHDAFCITNYNDEFQSFNGRICSGEGDTGLPDLKDNDWVKEQQRNYLWSLKGLGVTGMRIDAAKHMTREHINSVFTPQFKQGMFLFGEIITGGGSGNGEYDKFLKPYLDNTDHAAYDFPLHASMRRALGFGGSMQELNDPGAFGQALNGFRAVTFTITHDIPTNDVFRGQIMAPQDEHLAYAYIMGRDGGQPLVLSDKTGTDDGRWVDDYKQANIVAMIDFHNRVQGEIQENLYVDDCVLVFRRGEEGLVGINKCGGDATVNLNTNDRFKWFRDYRDVFSGDTFNISGSNLQITIPAREARMWYSL